MPSASPSYHQQQDNDSDSGRRTPVSFRAFKRLSSAVPLSSVAASGHDRPSSSSDLDPTPTTSTRSKPPPKPSSSTKPPFSRVRKAKAGSLSILGGRSSDKPVTPPPPHFLISQGIDAEIESQSSPKPTSGGFGSNLRLGMKKGAQDRHNMASTGPYQRNGAYIKKVIHKGIEGTTFMSEDEMRAAGIQIIKRGAEPPALPPRLAGAERPGFLERIGSPQAGSFSKEHQQVDSSSSLSSSSALGSQSLDLERPPNFTTGSSPPSPARATAVPFASTHFETGDSGSPPAPGASRQSGAATPFLSPAPGTFAHPYLNRHKVESGSYSKARAQSSASSVTSASRTLTRNAFGLGHYLSSDPASSSSSSSSPPPSKPPKPSFAFSGIEEPQSAGPVLYAKGVDTPTSDVHMLSSQLASGPSDQLSSTPMLKPPPRHKNVDSASGINQGRSSPTVGFFGQENGRLSPSSGGGAGGGGVAATLGQMGAAVGKKGWEFVRGLNGPASPAYRSGTAGGGSSSSQGGGGGWGFRTTGRASNLPQPMAADIASDVNEETRAWLEAAEISNPVNRELARSTIGLFGMPLRDAVVKTRLSADLDGSSPTSDVMPTSPRFGSKLSALDLGGDFCLPHDLLQGSLPSSPSSLKSPASPSVEACLPSKEREPLDREQARSYYLPRVVVRCIQSLEKWGPTEEGIYRLSGRSSHTNKLKGIFDSTARTNANGRSRKESSVGDLVLTEVSPADLDINSVCSVLKSYLRELPEKLIPSHLSSDFDRAGVKLTGASATGASAGIGLKNFGAAGATLSSRDAARAMDATTVAEGTKVGGERQVDLELLKSELLPVIQALPACHWYLLRELAEHLGWFASPDIVSKTKMVSRWSPF
ncbi:hypothetical protein IE53DRAFT_279027 [Violaceomyces palustris]|uniref:Uncharacterized protein n=1 Tax=Violaceomyces palustris TaxID=1673888 RepID=A0ACD0P376_9BASI|nr:hypothetical protein IE53DRAFT_279027 [Violaceomyces palustris]